MAQEIEGAQVPEVAQARQQEDDGLRTLMETFGVTLEEAEQARAWMLQLDDGVKELLTTHIPENRLLGEWIQWKPEWKFVIFLSGAEPAPSALTTAVSQVPIPVEVRVGGLPKEQLQAILEAELAERGGQGSVTEGTIQLVLPPPEGLPMDQFSAVAAELEAELEAKHGAMFDVVLGYETAVLLIPPAPSTQP